MDALTFRKQSCEISIYLAVTGCNTISVRFFCIWVTVLVIRLPIHWMRASHYHLCDKLMLIHICCENPVCVTIIAQCNPGKQIFRRGYFVFITFNDAVQSIVGTALSYRPLNWRTHGIAEQLLTLEMWRKSSVFNHKHWANISQMGNQCEAFPTLRICFAWTFPGLNTR